MTRLQSLRRCDTGATIVEFALVVPLFLTVVFGIFDIGLNLYANSVLQGAMQRVGRDFSMEAATSNRARLESFVRSQVSMVAPGAQVTFTRRSYFDFADIGQAETFDDINANNRCDSNEPFEDVNGNNTWDAERGRDNDIGGARDAVMLTAEVRHRRLFPLHALIGVSDQVVMRASTVLRNQPYDEQDRATTLGHCA